MNLLPDTAGLLTLVLTALALSFGCAWLKGRAFDE